MNLGGLFDLDQKVRRIEELDELMAQPEFWNNQEQAQGTINEANVLKSSVDRMKSLQAQYEDLQVMLELAREETDGELGKEAIQGVKSLRSQINEFELELLLSEPYDKNNAIIELHPGAGGTESQDWAEMLLRMYTRWADTRDFKVETIDYIHGDEAGIKSVTLLIKGHNAYGYLKTEKGVHRLVRISPFDTSGRRHTSFASCDVMPEIEDDDAEIEIRTEDLKIDTYRSGGAGGQHVNTTDSAVRITHLPSGVVVTCQSERSQIKNRAQAMKVLKGRLFEKQIEQQQKELAEIKGEQKDISWGSQIRSYVFHPYSMVKDHRTNLEIGNVQAVMDGDIDPFINAFLRTKLNK